MAFPSTRQAFSDRCLRALGFPVIEINVDEDQLGDRIEDALKKYWDYHTDGVERIYMKHQLTANEIANEAIPLMSSVDAPALIRGITKILPIYGNMNANINMFDVRYQYMLQNLPNFTSLSYVDYEITMMHLENINMLFNGIPSMRFNFAQNILYLDIDWSKDVKAGDFIIIECYRMLDPDQYGLIWHDPWLFKYATALIKRQWGINMKKYDGVQLVGGITFSGQRIYDEAVLEITALEQELRDTYEEPPRMILG